MIKVLIGMVLGAIIGATIAYNPITKQQHDNIEIWDGTNSAPICQFNLENHLYARVELTNFNGFLIVGKRP